MAHFVKESFCHPEERESICKSNNITTDVNSLMIISTHLADQPPHMVSVKGVKGASFYPNPLSPWRMGCPVPASWPRYEALRKEQPCTKLKFTSKTPLLMFYLFTVRTCLVTILCSQHQGKQ